MSLQLWSFGGGQVLNLRDEPDWRERSRDRIVVATSEGRATLAWNSWMPASVWCAVRGRMRTAGRDLLADCGADDVLVAEHGTRVTVQPAGAGEATLVGVLLPAEHIQDVARRELGRSLDEPLLLPMLVRHDAALKLRLLNLAHVALRRPGGELPTERLAQELVAHLVRRQAGYDAYVERCPGRSARYRRQVFSRLLRARNYIETTTAANSPLGRLAQVAKLSPTHFLRLYRDVFGQTPHKHVIETRLDAAREMLMTTVLGVSDICRSLGFENRCAFARVFKQYFGVAPSAMRQHTAAAGAHASRARPDDAFAIVATNR
ncbi:MAG TPA: AraC family transcriptional regulator [Candidatus Saccharimonadia bacterium]|nr:AraC family transcriptional regulator [Candidatus Saccharimonadia bacterium]